MNVIISPNIKRTSERIDPAGNIINARTKEVIRPVEPDFIPPTPSTPPAIPTPPVQTSTNSKLDEIISKKIEEIVAKKIEQILNNL